jgi:uroporphyrin-III C-methyltransferase/precorrin-2 dehydrogenase/sirohydrochlorin ferrochelatase
MSSRAQPSPLLQLVAAFHRWRRGAVAALPALPRARADAAAARRGHVCLIGAGPGAADLITLRGLQRLRAADAVFYDRLADPALLDYARPGAARIYVGKAPSCHAMPQAAINRLLVEAAQGGKRVVRLKCGDPGIFGRGAEEAAACDAAGIAWDVVPGVTSACAAAASARSFLTERRKTLRLVLATGHARADGEAPDWGTGAAPGTTLACYMGVAQAGAIMRGMIAAGWPQSCPVEVVSKAQTPHQSIHHCRLDQLETLCARHPGLNPAILMVRWALPGGADAAAAAARPGREISLPAAIG